MSFFDKVKASIGIGAAQVNTHLEKNNFEPGEEVKGVVSIQGGNIEQPINQVKIHLMTEVKRESNDKTYYSDEILKTYLIHNAFIIQKGEQKNIPFAFNLPLNVPISVGKTKVWLHTDLDIPNAIDPKDRDYLNISPHSVEEIIIKAVEKLGFSLKKVDCEYKHEIIQEFEFYPSRGKFKGQLDELEIVFDIQATGVNVRLQIDRKARGLAGMLSESLNMDETHLNLFISFDETRKGITYICDIFDQIISKYATRHF